MLFDYVNMLTRNEDFKEVGRGSFIHREAATFDISILAL